MGHGSEVVYLIGLGFLHDPGDIHGVSQIPVVEKESGTFHMWIDIEVVDAVGIEGGGASFYPVYDVAFLE